MNINDKVNNLLIGTLSFIPPALVWPVAKTYIAGETEDDAQKVITELNRKGISATVDILGEGVQNLDAAERVKNTYLDFLEKINVANLDADVSVKLTNFGLLVDKKHCIESVDELATQAKSFGTSVEIDREEAKHSEATLFTYRELREKHDNLVLCVQAMLKATYGEVQELGRGDYRLVKGIYREDPKIAYADPVEIRKSYIDILQLMAQQESFLRIATHDDVLIMRALELIKRGEIRKDSYEFQMLLGVRESLRNSLVRDSHPMRVYVPFGPEWYNYSMRRFKENPVFFGHVVRSLFTFLE